MLAGVVGLAPGDGGLACGIGVEAIHGLIGGDVEASGFIRCGTVVDLLAGEFDRTEEGAGGGVEGSDDAAFGSEEDVSGEVGLEGLNGIAFRDYRGEIVRVVVAEAGEGVGDGPDGTFGGADEDAAGLIEIEAGAGGAEFPFEGCGFGGERELGDGGEGVGVDQDERDLGGYGCRAGGDGGGDQAAAVKYFDHDRGCGNGGRAEERREHLRGMP